jgi:hypothetical protein
MRYVAFTIGTFLLASSVCGPAMAQDRVMPSDSAQQQKSIDQSKGTQPIGKDWKANPSPTVGNAGGMSPENANKDDTKKVDRDWRVKQGNDKK